MTMAWDDLVAAAWDCWCFSLSLSGGGSTLLSLSQRRQQHSTLSLSQRWRHYPLSLSAATALYSLSVSAAAALTSLSLSGDGGGGTILSLSQRAALSSLSLSQQAALSLTLSLSLSGPVSPLSLSLSGRPLSPLSFLSAQRAFEMCLGGGRILYCIGDSNYFRLTFWLLSPILMVTLLKKRQ